MPIHFFLQKMTLLLLLGVASTCFSLLFGQAQPSHRFRLPNELKEVSGLYIQSPDSLWWHNDSGDAARIFLTDGQGRLRQTIPLPQATHKDWEDMGHDPHGHIYIGDTGDNRRLRNDQVVYRYHPTTGALDSFPFQFPSGQHHDIEALFWHADSIHLFTKSRISRGHLPTYHYVLPLKSSAVAVPVLRDSVLLRKRVVTAAAIEPTSGRVALLAYYYTPRRWGIFPYSAANVFVFDGWADNRFLRGDMRSKRISCLLATQYESLDFLTASRIWVASEQTLFIRAKAKRVRLRIK
jgi:hypothetical protein